MVRKKRRRRRLFFLRVKSGELRCPTVSSLSALNSSLCYWVSHSALWASRHAGTAPFRAVGADLCVGPDSLIVAERRGRTHRSAPTPSCLPLRLMRLPPRREGRVLRGEGGGDGHIQSRSVPFRDQRREDCQSVRRTQIQQLHQRRSFSGPDISLIILCHIF